MDDPVKIISTKYKITADELEKIMYGLAKLVLYKKGINIQLYEPKFKEGVTKLELLNNETNEYYSLKVFEHDAILSFRNYLQFIISNLDSKRKFIDNIYLAAKLNNGIELEKIVNEFISISANPFIDQSESKINLTTKKGCYDFKTRFCPACQQRPCMCSDSDPD